MKDPHYCLGLALPWPWKGLALCRYNYPTLLSPCTACFRRYSKSALAHKQTGRPLMDTGRLGRGGGGGLGRATQQQGCIRLAPTWLLHTPAAPLIPPMEPVASGRQLAPGGWAPGGRRWEGRGRRRVGVVVGGICIHRRRGLGGSTAGREVRGQPSSSLHTAARTLGRPTGGAKVELPLCPCPLPSPTHQLFPVWALAGGVCLSSKAPPLRSHSHPALRRGCLVYAYGAAEGSRQTTRACTHPLRHSATHFSWGRGRRGREQRWRKGPY